MAAVQVSCDDWQIPPHPEGTTGAYSSNSMHTMQDSKYRYLYTSSNSFNIVHFRLHYEIATNNAQAMGIYMQGLDNRFIMFINLWLATSDL